ncbi:hypothetical protein BC936DRAFT_137743 [Jimgerdemannia flammicorona]|uniref:Uncharacterized protein n=1 Tax=Jimgerdemannia flammicorona TaxID=994334 RepID=A0A433DN19_9FUNG|nr:hypothetical protein BC936DRAFT_137743 [Jimgerdemannia flammicorona]
MFFFFFALSLPSVKIFDASTNELVSEILRPNAIEIGFSPKGTYISTWERPSKLEDGSGSKNLTVWDARTGNELASFFQKGQSNWNLQWTDGEEYCARMVTGVVHFWESRNVGKGNSSPFSFSSEAFLMFEGGSLNNES